MKAALQRMLAGHPSLHARVLRLLGRGSLEKRIYVDILRKGDVIFDIGANRGHFTRLFSDIAGPEGAVHAFEPVPSTFAMLSARMEARGGYANFTLNNHALGEAEGTVEIFLPGNDDGQASMKKHGSGSWREGSAEAHVCRVGMLDDYAAGLRRLDFIKCDVEGAELLVIKGGKKTVERLSPVLFLEVNPAWTKAFGYTPGELVARLRELDYDTFFLAEKSLVPFTDAEIHDSANLLCTKSRLHCRQLEALNRA